MANAHKLTNHSRGSGCGCMNSDLTLELRHLLGQLSLERLRKAGEQSRRQILLHVLFVLHLQGGAECD